MRRFWIATLFIALLHMVTIPIAVGEEGVNVAEFDQLANHSVWLKLLHYGKERERGEVLDDDYFLSPDGRNNPKSELTATLKAYSQPWPEVTDEHPRCRFPARYYWLSKQLPLEGYRVREPRCKNLEKWALFDKTKSISFLLVSGYLGNPGSTFGHSLLRLNTESRDDVTGLFDLSLSYGALIPDNEPTWRYVAKGVLGGYEGGFSDRYYYTQDLVYSHTEFRDVWEYELILSESERTFLLMHMWEVVGRKFDYLFLTTNCGYRLSELLELVVDELFLTNTRVWYIPVETFHRLNAVDAVRRKQGKAGLIKAVRFIPSSQRRLNHQVSLLSSDEKKAVEAIIEQGPESLSAQLARFEQGQQLNILNTLLAYHNYQLVKEQPEPDRERLKVKDQLLLARLRLPAEKEPLPTVPELNSPASGNRPSILGIGAGYESNEGPYLKMRWAPFSQETTGRNALEGDEIALLDSVIGLGGDHHRVFIEQLDFIRIRKLQRHLLFDDEESAWSWQLRVGARLSEHQDKPQHEGFFRFGVGHAWRLNDTLSLYAITDATLHTLSPHARLRPHAGLVANAGAMKLWLYGGAENRNYRGKITAVWGGEAQYVLADQVSFFSDFSIERSVRASAELRWHW